MSSDLDLRVAYARRMARQDPVLRLYAILDAESCARRHLPLLEVARAFREAGVQLLQYRDKTASQDTIRDNAEALRAIFPPGDVFLLLNDYPGLVAETGCDGAHVGQTDTAVAAARALLGPDRLLGISTHTADQALAAAALDVDYVAIGPVFSTQTKADAEPAVGLCGVQAARAVTRKPMVAIGGITAANGREVLHAGADSVALISALLPAGAIVPADVRRSAEDFLAAFK